ncbi:MAG: phosphate ABC transporter substrate-binding protein [Caldilineaceae bacterium]
MPAMPSPPRLFATLVLILLLSGCAQAAIVAPATVTITIAGSTEMRPVLNDLTVAYSERHPNTLFAIRGGGSLLGETWLKNGGVDLAASTAFSPEENAAAGLVRIPIALDGVAIVVHSDNAVESLTLAQLRDLYSGRRLNWQDVGGLTGDVLLVSREDGSATRMLFQERVMDGEGVSLTAVVMPTSGDVVEYVATHPDAIGYVSRAYLRVENEQGGPGVRLVAIESKLPTDGEVGAQTYPLSRPLFLVRAKKQTGLPVQSFIDFVLSPVGQEIVAKYHVPIR